MTDDKVLSGEQLGIVVTLHLIEELSKRVEMLERWQRDHTASFQVSADGEWVHQDWVPEGMEVNRADLVNAGPGGLVRMRKMGA